MSHHDKIVSPGIIVMWSGALVDIPTGWALCDGASGTPDLRRCFIVGDDGTSIGPSGTADPSTAWSHDAHSVTQPSAHSNHVLTQPAAHAFTQSGAHTNHVVTQPSNHGVHTHTSASSPASPKLYTANTSTGVAMLTGNESASLTHAGAAVDAHSAHSGAGVDAHSGTAVDAHSAHAGTAVASHAAHTPKRFQLAFLMKL